MMKISTIDVHVAGEPLRVITGGFPEPQGSSILEKRDFCRQHLDHLRRALMLEPRGHSDMYGALPVSSSMPDADMGVLFLHNEGYSTMCGHGIIGLTTVLLEYKFFLKQPRSPLQIETPSGMVTARAQTHEGKVSSVTFTNVPSFVDGLDEWVDVEGLGKVRYDLAFGGAYYAFCEAQDLNLNLDPHHTRSIIDLAMTIKRAIMATRSITHPSDPRLGFLYGVIFVGPQTQQESFCRQVCVFADGALDRSPTGTGVSAHLAILAARKKIGDDQPYRMESILGTHFTGRITERSEIHGRPAIIPEVTGSAHITGRHEFFIDPDDPLNTGFLLT